MQKLLKKVEHLIVVRMRIGFAEILPSVMFLVKCGWDLVSEELSTPNREPDLTILYG